jgi:hypothetical protein
MDKGGHHRRNYLHGILIITIQFESGIAPNMARDARCNGPIEMAAPQPTTARSFAAG